MASLNVPRARRTERTVGGAFGAQPGLGALGQGIEGLGQGLERVAASRLVQERKAEELRLQQSRFGFSQDLQNRMKELQQRRGVNAAGVTADFEKAWEDTYSSHTEGLSEESKQALLLYAQGKKLSGSDSMWNFERSETERSAADTAKAQASLELSSIDDEVSAGQTAPEFIEGALEAKASLLDGAYAPLADMQGWSPEKRAAAAQANREQVANKMASVIANDWQSRGYSEEEAREALNKLDQYVDVDKYTAIMDERNAALARAADKQARAQKAALIGSVAQQYVGQSQEQRNLTTLQAIRQYPSLEPELRKLARDWEVESLPGGKAEAIQIVEHPDMADEDKALSLQRMYEHGTIGAADYSSFTVELQKSKVTEQNKRDKIDLQSFLNDVTLRATTDEPFRLTRGRWGPLWADDTKIKSKEQIDQVSDWAREWLRLNPGQGHKLPEVFKEQILAIRKDDATLKLADKILSNLEQERREFAREGVEARTDVRTKQARAAMVKRYFQQLNDVEERIKEAAKAKKATK